MARRAGAVVRRQVPDEAVRAGRRLIRNASLPAAVDGRVVLINGTSAGVGRDVAAHLTRAGATVIAVDASDAADAERIAAQAIDDHGRVDVLVNAPPPLTDRATASDDKAEDIARRALETGYYAPVRLILALIPAMRLNGRGHVVNVCLAAGGAREPGCAAQIAAAAALDAFGRCFAPEVDELRIPVTTVHVALAPDANAARRVCEAIVHRPKRVGTPWGTRDPIAVVSPTLTGARN